MLPTYKIVSEWNLKNNVSKSSSKSGVLKLSNDTYSPSNGGSYDILYSSGIRGSFSKIIDLSIKYFYESGNSYVVEDTGFNGYNPQIVMNGSNVFIVYYDTDDFVIKSLERMSGVWQDVEIDFVNVFSAKNKQISMVKDSGGGIHASYVFNFSNEENGVRYAFYDGSNWIPEDVDIDVNPLTCSIVYDSVPVLIVGAIDGVYIYRKSGDVWISVGSVSSSEAVVEVDAVVYESDYKIALIESGKICYTSFDSDSGIFSDISFVDFSSSSCSIDLKSDGSAIMSYAHVETEAPLTYYLKIAEEDNGSLVSSNVSFMNSGNVGEFSAISVRPNDKYAIVHFANGVKIYDREKYEQQNNIIAASWGDVLKENSLTASSTAPLRNDLEGYFDFSSSNENFFYILDEDQSNLHGSDTSLSFSVNFRIDKSTGDRQHLVTKGDSYGLYIGGDSGLKLGFYFKTSRESIDEEVKELSVDKETKVSLVYSGFDVKIYIKQSGGDFEVYRYNIFGDVFGSEEPFVVAARATLDLPYYNSSSSSSLNSSVSSSSRSSSSSLNSSSSSESSSSDSSSLGSSDSSSSDSSTSSSSSTRSSSSESSSNSSSNSESYSSSTSSVNSSSISSDSSSSSLSSIDVQDFSFSGFFDGKIFNIKFWNRELDYDEATYEGDDFTYAPELDIYGDGLNYSENLTGLGSFHYVMNGESFSNDDYGLVDRFYLHNYSRFMKEDRITNMVGDSFNPTEKSTKDGGMVLVWAEEITGGSELHIKDRKNNIKMGINSNSSPIIKASGSSLSVFKDSDVVIDVNARFIKNRLTVGDMLNISGSDSYLGRSIPIIEIIDDTSIRLSVVFSGSEDDIGYFVSSHDDYEESESTSVTNLSSSSYSPDITIDAVGDVHIVWSALNGDIYDVFYKRYRRSLNEKQIWGEVRLTDKVRGNSSNPSIVIDGDHSMHLVWEDTRSSKKSIMYARSSGVIDGDTFEVKYPYWTSSNCGGQDRLLSDELICKMPKASVNKMGSVFVTFAGRGESDESYSLFCIDNESGVLSNYYMVFAAFDVAESKTVFDSKSNAYIVFTAKLDNKYDIYLTKRIGDKWSDPIGIWSSKFDSIKMSCDMGNDNVIYISWIESGVFSDVLKFAKYDIENDTIEFFDSSVSSGFGKDRSSNVSIDESNTVTIHWEDDRLSDGIEKNSEIFSTSYSGMSISSESLSVLNEEDALSQIAQEIIGNEYSDVGSGLLRSDESLSDVVVSYSTATQLFEVPYEIYGYQDPIIKAPLVVLYSRRIGVKVEGLNGAIAYRIKNVDDSSSQYTEFRRYTENEFEWILSSGNGEKRVGIQFYTINGLTDEIVQTLYVKESDTYQISIHLNDGDVEEVTNEYNGKKALKSGLYWAKIIPNKYVDISTEKLVFDVELQGNNIQNIETNQKEEGVFWGQFTLQPEDGISNIDGDSKIIPKIVSL